MYGKRHYLLFDAAFPVLKDTLPYLKFKRDYGCLPNRLDLYRTSLQRTKQVIIFPFLNTHPSVLIPLHYGMVHHIGHSNRNGDRAKS